VEAQSHLKTLDYILMHYDTSQADTQPVSNRFCSVSELLIDVLSCYISLEHRYRTLIAKALHGLPRVLPRCVQGAIAQDRAAGWTPPSNAGGMIPLCCPLSPATFLSIRSGGLPQYVL
jgi:hypothetical protein